MFIIHQCLASTSVDNQWNSRRMAVVTYLIGYGIPERNAYKVSNFMGPLHYALFYTINMQQKVFPIPLDLLEGPNEAEVKNI